LLAEPAEPLRIKLRRALHFFGVVDMRASCVQIAVFIVTMVMLPMFGSCGKSEKRKPNEVIEQLEKSQAKIASGTTIGQLADVFAPDYIPVQGYALVGGLAGTGSADCPPNVRGYLTQEILHYVPSEDVDKLINSADTSVVIAEGLMPTAGKGTSFDVRVSVPADAQTTSLEHGQLYGAELRAAGSFGLAMRVLAYVEGPVYIDKIEGAANKKVGYILGGGRVLNDYRMMLSVREPDYLVASAIRNKLVEHYGQDSAKALSPGQVELVIPAKYAGRKAHFIAVLKAMYLNLSTQDRDKRISELLSQLAGSGDREAAEIGLEAIGKESLDGLKALLKSTDADVRFHAARCMLNLGSDGGLDELRKVAFDASSPRRMEAMEVIAAAGRRNDASVVCRRLLRDEDVRIRLAAYEQLRRTDDIAVNEELIGRDFYLEQISLSRQKLIFVSRSGEPRIAIFGGPIYCKSDLFIESEDGNITLNAPPGQDYVTIIRKIAGKREIPPVSIQCSYELSDIIRNLGAEPTRRRPDDRVGLGVSYSDIIALVHEMVEKGAIDSKFEAGPLPQITLK
jgi:flagellar basal body P-ring protein FlgI